ncbi:MAG: bifunctional glutamate N-acetyltransferase/amino-acid acetyltransferase ArgJ [Acidimicrobiales bacterium]
MGTSGSDGTVGPRLPPGFAALVGRAGVRSGPGDDVCVVWATGAATCAAVFTRSRFAGPSVTLSRARAAAGRARGLVVVAGNANVATGAQGERDAAELGALAAGVAGAHPSELVVASTGVIGRPYPMEAIRAWFALAGAAASGSPGPDARCTDSAGAVARAIMTTDTVAKTASRGVGPVSVVGVAKGVGMIQPDMATMLAFVLTDAAVEPDVLDRAWRRAVDRTFNCLSVDGDTSTSDSAVVLASGVAGAVAEVDLAVALQEVCLDLTLQLARDGEGATKLLTVTVRAARDEEQARRVAKAVVNSPLVKTAVHGGDPNWGRVAMAVGKVDDHDIRPSRVVIRFGDLEAYPAVPGPEGLDELAGVMAEDHVEIEVDLGAGDAEATAYGCDLSAEYVRINADYTT